MTTEKKLTKHIQKIEGNHPGKDLRVIHILQRVPDPRGPSCNFKHPLNYDPFYSDCSCALWCK